MPNFQQYKVYLTVILSSVSGEQEREWWISSTRQEAEAEARTRMTRTSSSAITGVTISRMPVLVENSPKRAFISGLIQGTNLTSIEALGDGATEIMGTWTPETGWLTRDERSKARRVNGTDLNPSEC